MKKLLGSLVIFFLIFTAGFWTSEKDVLDGTQAGDVLLKIVTPIPVPESFQSLDKGAVTESDFTTDAFRHKLNGASDSATATETKETVIENRVFEKLNALRKELGAPELTKNPVLKAAADTRAKETETSFDHTRPNGEEPFTVLSEPAHTYEYRLAGENLGMATYVLSDEEMADVIFNGWVESKGHYENMINSEFREVGIGVHNDGESLYLTQLFGTPFGK